MSVSRALSGNEFQARLAFGQIAETLIAKWLIARGRIVLPIYDVEIDAGKGPRIFSANCEAAAPDLLVFRGDGSFVWCEAKHKSVFTWYRKKRQWTTGIDSNHWEHYRRVAQATGVPVWMLFLHQCSVPSESDSRHGCETECPTGLFGNTLGALAESISHESDNHGRYGMVYWAHESLRLIASLESVRQMVVKGPW